MVDYVGLRYVERSAIFIFLGILSYKFIESINMVFSYYNFLNGLVLFVIWSIIWMGTSSLVRRLLMKALKENY
jgi:hypothetical protein